MSVLKEKYGYKELSKGMFNDIKQLIHKYENEGDYYMDENDKPQLRTSKDVVEDLRKIISIDYG